MGIVKYIIFITFITLTTSTPLKSNSDEDSSENSGERGVNTNNLFHQLNAILGQSIAAVIGHEPIEIGDKFTNNKTNLQITVEKFSYDNTSFPVTFKPNNHSLFGDKEIVSVNGDSEEVVIYRIDSQEAVNSTVASDVESTTDKNIHETSTSAVTVKTTEKSQKLLSDIAAQSILTAV